MLFFGIFVSSWIFWFWPLPFCARVSLVAFVAFFFFILFLFFSLIPILLNSLKKFGCAHKCARAHSHNQRTAQHQRRQEPTKNNNNNINSNIQKNLLILCVPLLLTKVFCLSFPFLPNAFILTCLLTCSLTQHLHILHKQAPRHTASAHTRTHKITSCLFFCLV